MTTEKEFLESVVWYLTDWLEHADENNLDAVDLLIFNINERIKSLNLINQLKVKNVLDKIKLHKYFYSCWNKSDMTDYFLGGIVGLEVAEKIIKQEFGETIK